MASIPCTCWLLIIVFLGVVMNDPEIEEIDDEKYRIVKIGIGDFILSQLKQKELSENETIAYIESAYCEELCQKKENQIKPSLTQYLIPEKTCKCYYILNGEQKQPEVDSGTQKPFPALQPKQELKKPEVDSGMQKPLLTIKPKREGRTVEENHSVEQANKTSGEQENNTSSDQAKKTSGEQENKTSAVQTIQPTGELTNQSSLEPDNQSSAEDTNPSLRDQANQATSKKSSSKHVKQNDRASGKKRKRTSVTQTNETIVTERKQIAVQQTNQTLAKNAHQTPLDDENLKTKFQSPSSVQIELGNQSLSSELTPKQIRYQKRPSQQARLSANHFQPNQDYASFNAPPNSLSSNQLESSLGHQGQNDNYRLNVQPTRRIYTKNKYVEFENPLKLPSNKLVGNRLPQPIYNQNQFRSGALFLSAQSNNALADTSPNVTHEAELGKRFSQQGRSELDLSIPQPTRLVFTENTVMPMDLPASLPSTIPKPDPTKVGQEARSAICVLKWVCEQCECIACCKSDSQQQRPMPNEFPDHCPQNQLPPVLPNPYVPNRPGTGHPSNNPKPLEPPVLVHPPPPVYPSVQPPAPVYPPPPVHPSIQPPGPGYPPPPVHPSIQPPGSGYPPPPVYRPIQPPGPVYSPPPVHPSIQPPGPVYPPPPLHPSIQPPGPVYPPPPVHPSIYPPGPVYPPPPVHPSIHPPGPVYPPPPFHPSIQPPGPGYPPRPVGPSILPPGPPAIQTLEPTLGPASLPKPTLLPNPRKQSFPLVPTL